MLPSRKKKHENKQIVYTVSFLSLDLLCKEGMNFDPEEDKYSVFIVDTHLARI